MTPHLNSPWIILFFHFQIADLGAGWIADFLRNHQNKKYYLLLSIAFKLSLSSIEKILANHPQFHNNQVCHQQKYVQQFLDLLKNPTSLQQC